MKILQFGALAAMLIAPCAAAQADVQWEHVITVRMSTLKDPVGKLTVDQYFTEQRHRVDLNFDLQGMAQGNPHALSLGSLPSAPQTGGLCAVAPKNKFDATSITRYDDDTALSYSSLDKNCYSDTIEAVFSKLRFDPWKSLSPDEDLEANPPLTFTPEQRSRLGAEYRAALRPLFKQVMRIYYHKLNNQRTFNGIPAHGYRLTTLINAGGLASSDEQWMKISYEWWMADQMPGDEAVASIQKQGADKLASLGTGFPTTSMWLNELMPIWWACTPEEYHQALETIQAPDGSFMGTPVAMFATIEMPPMQRAMSGDMHIDVMLTKRDTSALPANTFDAPADYTKKPFISPWDELEKAIKGKFKLPISEAMGLSWKAWHECSRKMKFVSPLAPGF